MKQIKIDMTLERETKGAVLYVADNPAIQNVYIKKLALPSPPPKELILTVEFDA